MSPRNVVASTEKPVAERDDDAHEGQRDACPLRRAQLLAGDEPRKPQRGQHRRQVDEHDHSRGGRVGEARVDQREFAGEKQSGDDAGGERAVALQRARCRAQRAQAITSTQAMPERIAPCITSEMPGAASLTATCWNPHSDASSIINTTASRVQRPPRFHQAFAQAVRRAQALPRPCGGVAVWRRTWRCLPAAFSPRPRGDWAWRRRTSAWSWA